MRDIEQLADSLRIGSGRIHHTNTCATSLAPAEEPGPCDCAEEFVRILYPHAVLHPWNGPHGSLPRTYQIYPDDSIFHALSDLDLASPELAWESAAQRISERIPVAALKREMEAERG